MEQPSKILEQIAYRTRPKIEEHMLIVMDESTHEEHLTQPLQTNYKQFKIAVTFLNVYDGRFENISKNYKFHFKKTISDGEDLIQISILPKAYEIEGLNEENKRIIINEGLSTEANYPFKIKPNFSTLGNIIETSPQGAIISFALDDTIRNVLGFREPILYQEYNLSHNPVDIFSFDNNFLECDIAHVMIFRGKGNGVIHNFTMDVDPGSKNTEKFRGGIQWYMMDFKDFISSNNFELKNENNKLVSFNGQSVTFRLAIKNA